MPVTLILKLLGGIAVIGVLWGLHAFVERGGYNDGVAEYKPRLDDLQAQIDAADMVAANTKIQQEKDNELLTTAHDKRIATIRNYYERLRVQAPRSPSAIAPAGCPVVLDGAASQHPDAGLDFEYACALDASRLNSWIDWATRHQLPVLR